jgi:hypothetical protein
MGSTGERGPPGVASSVCLEDWYPLAELAREVDENNRNLLDVNQCGGALKGLCSN